MTSQQIIFVILLWIICQVRLHQGHNGNNMSAIIRKEYFWFSNTYACVELQQGDVDYFSLNVSLNTSASLFLLSSDVNVVDSSLDKLWHFLKSKGGAGPFDDIEVNFILSNDDIPLGGNCSFSLEHDINAPENTPSIHETSRTQINPSPTVDSEYILSTAPPYVASTLEVGETNLFQTASVNSSEDVITTMGNTSDSLPTVLPDDPCLCPCECLNPMSQKNANQMLLNMIENLRIPKFLTSQTKRKLFSAPDSRTSSKGIGLVGLFVLTSIFGVIVIGDIKLFVRNIRTAARRVHGRFAYMIRST